MNEVESSDGENADWVELANPTDAALDVSGIVISDDDDTHRYTVPAGTEIAAGGYLVVDGDQLGFGLGSNDRARLFEGDTIVDESEWTSHAATTWGRCPDLVGAFGVTESATRDAANACAGAPTIPTTAWPGSPEVTVLDETTMFKGDSSGLDLQQTEDGTFLWAVDNGTGVFWKLVANADGSVEFADGWTEGKRARFQRDAANPGAAGPDAEGITVDGDGRLYIGSERDNSAKGVNRNEVLLVDPEEPGPDVIAAKEWDLTPTLPQVAANTGIEAVEWVPDDALAGRLVDASTGAPYDPADYPTHGDGLFFVAVEENGFVYAYALGSDGSVDEIAAVDPGLGGVMALDYDTVLGELWAVCDDGCEGLAARIGFASAGIEIAHVERPAGMPNLNNEGFATAPAELSAPDASAPASRRSAAAVFADVEDQATTRPVWWFADGQQPAALRTGTLPGTDASTPGDGSTPGSGGDGSGASGSGDASGANGTSNLANTGVDDRLLVIAPIALLIVIGGAALVWVARRRRRALSQG